MRAFVGGATGYTGRAVVTELKAAGIVAVAHVRPDSPRLAEWKATFQKEGATADATPWDRSALAATLARIKPEIVFALLGTTRARGRASMRERGVADSYESVDYGLSAMLLGATLDSKLRPRFVYLSAVGVRADTQNPYLKVRWRFENELKESGVPYTIVRPSFITGDDREESRPMERVAAMTTDALGAVARVFGAKRFADTYQSITSAALARELVRMATDPAFENRIVDADEIRR
jgi:uncharacterized protein YbjT (DUF2867 family)